MVLNLGDKACGIQGPLVGVMFANVIDEIGQIASMPRKRVLMICRNSQMTLTHLVEQGFQFVGQVFDNQRLKNDALPLSE